MISYLKEFVWYLKRPKLYPEFLRVIKSKLNRQKPIPDTRLQSTELCSSKAISYTQAISQITGYAPNKFITEKYSDIFSEAKRKVISCPVILGGAASLDLLYWMAEFLQARNVIETGVAYGWSSLALLLSLTNRNPALLISTDMPCRGLDTSTGSLSSDKYVGCVVPPNLKNNWQIIPKADREAIPIALRKIKVADLIHYDSDKSYTGRSWAYPVLWNALRDGGYLISDDIGDNLAFNDFCLEIDQKPIIVEVPADPFDILNNKKKFVGIILKQ